MGEDEKTGVASPSCSVTYKFPITHLICIVVAGHFEETKRLLYGDDFLI